MNARLVAIFTGPALAGLVLLALLDAAAKGAVILLGAAVAALVMRRASAASRHHVWLCALGCALVLPLASWMLPQWRALPGWMRWEELPKRLMVAPATQTESGSMAVETKSTNSGPSMVDESSAAALPPAPSDPAIPHHKSRISNTPFRLDARWLLGVWAVGSVVLLLPLALSAFALGRKCQRTQIVNEGALAEAVAVAQRDLGLTQRVRVLLGERDAMPMVWGVFRLCLLLPADVVEWTPQRLRAVLLHELAHLRRRDPIWQLVAHCGLALHWFNPLAWFAVRRLRIEQEHACDDFVLRAGIRASEYAADMLAIVGNLRPAPFSAAALTMANRARLEGRITGILDGARNRRALTGWIAAAAVLIATVLALPLAMLRAADEKKAAPPASAVPPKDLSVEKEESAPAAPAGKLRSATRTGDYDLGDGRKLYICRPDKQRQWFSILWPESERWPKCLLRIEPNLAKHADVKWAVVWEPGAAVLWWADETDVAKVRLTDPANVLVDREGRENNFSRDFGLTDEVKEEFRKLGFVIGRDKTPGRELLIGGNTGGQTILSAQTLEKWSVEGVVTDADGKPLANVPIAARSEYRPTVDLATAVTDAQGRYHVTFGLDLETLAKFRGIEVRPALAGFTERELARSGGFHALLFGSEQPQRVPHPVPRIDEEFKPGPIPRFGEHDLVAAQQGRADFVMLPAGEIVGRIVTTEGAPLPNYFVSLAAPQQRAGYSVASASSDERGQFRLAGIPTNQALVFTINPGGKPSETAKAAPEKFETAKVHHVRVVAPPANSGAPLKIERTEGEPNPPAAAESGNTPGVVDGIAAVVNDEVITFSQVRDLVAPLEKAARDQYKGNELVEKIKEIRLKAIKDLIDRQLILQKGESRLELERAEATLARLAKLRSENSVSSQEVDEARMKVDVLKAELVGDKTAAARARLAHAESELKRATELLSQKLISQKEIDEIRMRVEVLKAELVGDNTAAARARLAHAESELKRAAELSSQKLISQQEVDGMRMRVEVLKAEMVGDEPAAARVRLAHAESELKRVTELNSQRLISSEELDQARAAVEVRMAELAGDRLAVARAQLAQAEAQLKRVAALREQKLVAEAEFESAKMAVEVARAAIEAAKSQPQLKPGGGLVVVEIHADGTIHIGTKTLSLAELEKYLAELRREDPALAVTLAAATAVDYTSVTAVLNVLKTAGISNATLQAKPSASDDAPAPQQKWMATGRVTDKDGNPMEGVLISVDAGMGSLLQTGKATTGADGRYNVEFTQGVMMEKDSPGLQFASITAHKPRFFEKNLNRHGAGAMALHDVAADELKGYGVAAEALALPRRARTVDFVMLPAARIKGRLLGTGKFQNLTPAEVRNDPKRFAGFTELNRAPLAGWQLWLKGKALPPGTSVICPTRTDKDGNFVMEDVPTGYEWQFLGETNRRETNVRDVPEALSRDFFKLRNAADYTFSLELPKAQDHLELEIQAADASFSPGKTPEFSNPE